MLLDYFKMDMGSMINRISDQINFYSDRITIAPDIGIIREFDRKDIERTIYPCIEAGFPS
ncbi:MAG: hypothetical protein JEY91_08795 [Spirochaetaceae bacterium]|nr:hypothetical protein [Spirochaetaceae bacterium]